MARLDLLWFTLSALPGIILTAAQSDDNPSFILDATWDRLIPVANATGVYNFPGLSIGDNQSVSLSNDPTQDWQLNRIAARDPDNLTTIVANAITIPQNQTLPDSPYVTCAQVFRFLDDVSRENQMDDGSCSQLFGTECLQGLRAYYLEEMKAAASSGRQREEDFCLTSISRIRPEQYPTSCQVSLDSILPPSVEGLRSESTNLRMPSYLCRF